MCDTMVALPPATADGSVLFGKNSDRERNEAQRVEWHAAAAHAPDSALRCTYLTIPQARATRAVLICRPFWGWGAEMGANDAGIVIGNEAVFSHLVPPAREPALTGMDLLRLALERSGDAAEAVAVITALLERHGQGGNCGHLHEHLYHNSFLIADRTEAFVLETIGRFWALERAGSIHAISNVLGISGPVQASDALLADARARDLCTGLADLDLAAYHDPERESLACGRMRRSRATALLSRGTGHLTAADLRATLRDHGAAAQAEAPWHPAHAIGRSICMHAGDEDRRGQSVGSLVSELRPDGRSLHWITGTAAPCLSLFRPILVEASPAASPGEPTDHADPAALWWHHEALHRRAIRGDFATLLAQLAPDRDALEARFQHRMDEALATDDIEAARQAVTACWREADAWESRWSHAGVGDATLPPAFTATWRAHDDHARSQDKS